MPSIRLGDLPGSRAVAPACRVRPGPCAPGAHPCVPWASRARQFADMDSGRPRAQSQSPRAPSPAVVVSEEEHAAAWKLR